MINQKRIEYSHTFNKQLIKAPLDIKIAFRKRFELFLRDTLHPQLHNHQLKGKYQGTKSINITGDWRALYTEKSRNSQTIVTFELLGTHNQLYR